MMIGLGPAAIGGGLAALLGGGGLTGGAALTGARMGAQRGVKDLDTIRKEFMQKSKELEKRKFDSEEKEVAAKRDLSAKFMELLMKESGTSLKDILGMQYKQGQVALQQKKLGEYVSQSLLDRLGNPVEFADKGERQEMDTFLKKQMPAVEKSMTNTMDLISNFDEMPGWDKLKDLFIGKTRKALAREQMDFLKGVNDKDLLGALQDAERRFLLSGNVQMADILKASINSGNMAQLKGALDGSAGGYWIAAMSRIEQNGGDPLMTFFGSTDPSVYRNDQRYKQVMIAVAQSRATKSKRLYNWFKKKGWFGR
jgi:hypothetical protein